MENNKYLSAKYTVIELANFSNKAAIQSFRGVVTLHLFTNEIVCFKWLLTNQLSRDCVSRHFLWPILLSCLPLMKIRAIYNIHTVLATLIRVIHYTVHYCTVLDPGTGATRGPTDLIIHYILYTNHIYYIPCSSIPSLPLVQSLLVFYHIFLYQ